MKVLARKKAGVQPPLPTLQLQELGAQIIEDQETFFLFQLPLPNASASPGILRDVADVVDLREDFDILGFRASPIDARESEPSYPVGWGRQIPLPSPLRDAFLLQFATMPRNSWLQEFREAGISILDYVPQNGYVVLGDEAVLQAKVQQLPIQLFRLHQPFHKASETARSVNSAFADVSVSIANVPEAVDALTFLQAQTIAELRVPENAGDRTIHRLTVTATILPQIAALPAVLWVEIYSPPVPSGQREAHLCIGDTLVSSSGTLRPVLGDHREWISLKGLGNYKTAVKLAILDTGFDLGLASSMPSTNVHPDFKKSSGQSFVEVRNYTTSPDDSDEDCYGHGTFVAGVLAGNAGVSPATVTKDSGNPATGDPSFFMGLGILPESPIIVGRVVNYQSANLGPKGYDHQDLEVVYGDLASRGVAIVSNSFNHPTNTLYTDESQLHDKLVRSANGSNGGPPMTIYVSGGNDESDPLPLVPGSITFPATAKNMITVGGSENVNGSSYLDNLGSTSDSFANDGNQMWARSRIGPTGDGRIKPDLVAPASGIESPYRRDPVGGPSQCVLPIPGTIIDNSSGQRHMWSRGTSFAAPLAAGAGALLYTWFRNNNPLVPAPKPALIKAMQITLARELTGSGHPPDSKQGWGKVDLQRLFAPNAAFVASNEEPTTLLSVQGQSVFLPGSAGAGYRIKDTSQPVRVTIVWTDRFGTPATDGALVNNLDLTVQMQGGGVGSYFLGNDFNSAGHSNIRTPPLGNYDIKNNVEQVVFTAAEAGTDQFDVQVVATTLAGDAINAWSTGVTNQQDFALFIENAVTVPAGATRFNTLTPCRVLDTRDAPGPYGGPALAGQQSRSFMVRGRCGVASTAKAVTANLTVIPTGGDGYLTAYANEPPPVASTMNLKNGLVRANNAVLTMDSAGNIRIFSNAGPTHLLLDVSGYFV
ncbi:MAG: S8 family serine peptidase [Gemmatimonadales bacterium]